MGRCPIEEGIGIVARKSINKVSIIFYDKKE